MVTYGFYNSINHDRVYDATQMSEIFDGIIRDGVYQYVGNKFLVDINGLEGFQVRVGTGRAWFNHTWTKNDAPLILTLPAPPTLDNYYRADAIVIDINANVNVRENKITYVTGTEVADNPSPPYPELLDGEHKQIALAYIVRKGAETEINAANINYVVGSSPCPYVTAPVQAVDLSAHVAKWQAAWEQWFQGPNGYVQTQARAFKAEIAAAEAIIENATGDINEDVAEFRVWIASQKSQFNGWMDDSKNDFDSWFANLQYILDGDVAGHLQNEITYLQNRITPIENGGTGNADGYIRTGFKKKEDYSLGKFSTSEGMNTVSTGQSSHAEGGGGYSYTHRDAHIEGEEVWESDQYTNAYQSTYFQPAHPSISNMIGKAGGQITFSLDLPGSNGQIVYGNGTFSNVSASAWAILDNSNHYVDGGIISNIDTELTIYTNLGSVIFSLSHTLNGNGTTFNGDYNYSYSVFGTASAGSRSSYKFVFLDSPYNNDVIFDGELGTYGQDLVYQGSETKPTDKNIQALYVTAVLKNETTGEVLKTETGCIGSACMSDNNYIGNRGGFSDYGWFSYDYEDENETVGSNKPVRYWYIDGSDVSNSKILVKGTFKFVIDNKLAWIYQMSYDSQSSESSGIIIKAGNQNTYSFKLYYNFSYDENKYYPITWIPEGESVLITGIGVIASGDYSHAEGLKTLSSGRASHAEGNQTVAHGFESHAEGLQTDAHGDYSHAEGSNTLSNGIMSHAEGYHTAAYGRASHVGGQFVEVHDPGRFVHGYQPDPRNNLIGNERILLSNIFGIGGEPRFFTPNSGSSSDETTSTDSEEIESIINKNKNGFTVLLRCGTAANTTYYKTLLPNDTFATYLELIEVDDGPLPNKVVACSARMLLLSPGSEGDNTKPQLFVAAILYDTGNGLVSKVITQDFITINGYKYITLEVKNKDSSYVSNSDANRFIKYSLIRIM